MGSPRLCAFERERAFERITEAKALRNPRGVITGDFNGDGRCDLGSYSTSKIGLLLRQSQSAKFDLAMVSPRTEVDTVICFQANRDNSTDFLIVGSGRTSLHMYTGGRTTRFSPRWEYEVPEGFDHIFVGDLNSDGSDDIATWSRNRTGVEVFLGKGNAMFARPVPFLAEMAVGAMYAGDLDGDGVSDVAVADWVTNELSLLHGFGKMKFSEPSIVRLESEPSHIRFLVGAKESLPTVLVVFPQEGRLNLYSSMSNEGYRLIESIGLHDPVTGMEVQDVNHDANDEVLLYSPGVSRLTVWFDLLKSGQEGSVAYATGRNTISCAPIVGKAARCEGFALLDTSLSMIRMLWSPGTDLPDEDDRCFAVGSGPVSIMTLPSRAQRLRDVLVINAGSGDISYLENATTGLQGSVSIPSPFGPGRALLIQRTPTEYDIVSSHASTDSILITSIDLRRSSSTVYAIPTETPSTVVAAFLSDENRRLRMYTLDSDPARTTRTLTVYDQLTAGRFLERGLSVSGHLLDAAIMDLNHDGVRDMIDLQTEGPGRGTVLSLRTIAPSYNLEAPRILLRVSETELASAFLWPHDMNRDGLPDLLLYGGEPDGSLRLASNRGDTTFSEAITITGERVSISSPDRIQIVDLNGDGFPDIILINARTKTLEMFLSTRKPVYQGPVRLLSSEGIAAFRIEDIDRDGIFEALLADELRGYLRIIRLRGVL
jgi:hypothetical protein